MEIIKNKEELLDENKELREKALDILEAGLEAIDTKTILRKKLEFNEGVLCIEGMDFKCSFYERIFFIGIGKCAFEGAKVVEDIFGDYLTQGIVIDVKGGILKKIKSYEGTHPYPSEQNVTVTKEILEMIKGVTERDLVLILISGGGSSLLCAPHMINCEKLVEITKELTKKGADIYELNTVRKHLSEVQGGELARLCFPAQTVSLIFSDVLGNDLSMIASGPTVLDNTTIEDAKNILEKYQISFDQDTLIETPKDPKYFENVKNILMVSNKDALVAMKEKAESFGFDTKIETETLSGNATEIGKEFAKKTLSQNTCLLFGGETTVEIKDGGEGGRNQEMALSALLNIEDDRVLICSSSDGWDNTPFAGALVDKYLLEKTKKLNISSEEFLNSSDSFNFFKKVGGGISTGRLGSNVSDLVIILYGSR